jgi:RNA polymerase sigma-70 factor, ECF subfamily
MNVVERAVGTGTQQRVLANRGTDSGEVPTARAAAIDRSHEAVLLDDCAHGDAEAWRKLHRMYFPLAEAFLRKLGVSDRDIEDATQDVFLELFRYLPRFRREAELSTWLYRLCITQARRARRRAQLGGLLSRVLTLAAGPAFVSTPSLPDELARKRVLEALSTLTDMQRTVFVLYEFEGLPGKQIAEIVDAPEASVWRRLHDARQAFRRAVQA